MFKEFTEEIKILNISGQVVMMPGNNKDIDISGLNNGLYFAKILTNKGQISKKKKSLNKDELMLWMRNSGSS